jgi:hypothetical protein
MSITFVGSEEIFPTVILDPTISAHYRRNLVLGAAVMEAKENM